MGHTRMFCLVFLAATLSVSPIANALPGAPCASASGAKSQEHAAGAACDPHFTYTPGPHGPAHWGGSCNSNTAKTQSPINISHAVVTPLPPLEFAYQDGGLSMLNDCDHWRILVNIAPGSTLKYGGHTYTLEQFHFHEPAETLVKGGHPLAMEVHLVHKGDDGSGLVVAALIQPGRANELIKTLWSHIPPKGEKYENENIKINADGLLPENKGFYLFPGSLTTPGCDEGVTWIVFKEPIRLSPMQIARYKTQYHGTARRVQPVNDRKIEQTE